MVLQIILGQLVGCKKPRQGTGKDLVCMGAAVVGFASALWFGKRARQTKKEKAALQKELGRLQAQLQDLEVLQEQQAELEQLREQVQDLEEQRTQVQELRSQVAGMLANKQQLLSLSEITRQQEQTRLTNLQQEYSQRLEKLQVAIDTITLERDQAIEDLKVRLARPKLLSSISLPTSPDFPATYQILASKEDTRSMCISNCFCLCRIARILMERNPGTVESHKGGTILRGVFNV